MTTTTENTKCKVKKFYPTPSRQTRSGFSCPDSWTKACRREKLQSVGCPGQDTQPDPPGTVDLEGGTTLQHSLEKQHQQWLEWVMEVSIVLMLLSTKNSQPNKVGPPCALKVLDPNYFWIRRRFCNLKVKFAVERSLVNYVHSSGVVPLTSPTVPAFIFAVLFFFQKGGIIKVTLAIFEIAQLYSI